MVAMPILGIQAFFRLLPKIIKHTVYKMGVKDRAVFRGDQAFHAGLNRWSFARKTFA